MVEKPNYPTTSNTDNKCCDHPHLIQTIDSWVCENCGMVHDQNYEVQARRSYNYEEFEKRTINEPKHPYNVGGRTVFYAQEIKGLPSKILVQKKHYYNRLAQINCRYIAGKERSIVSAQFIIFSIASYLPYNIPKHVVFDVRKLVKHTIDKNLCKGRMLSALVATAYELCCRMHEIPIDISMLNEILGIKTYVVMRYYSLLYKVMRELGWRIKINSPELLITSYGKQLGCSDKLITNAKKIYELVGKLSKNYQCGKSHKGIASGCLYLASILSREKLTQRHISVHCDITEVTLRNRSNEIKKIVYGHKLIAEMLKTKQKSGICISESCN